MAKKLITDNQTDLYSSEAAGRRTSPRRRALILPSLLREESIKNINGGKDQDRAQEIIEKWADLELGGHLRVKETARDAEFLEEVFGQALGYKTPTSHPEAYHIERQFSVPGIGSADGAIGQFPLDEGCAPHVIIELKAANVDLDRDRSRGRTAVQQCWDYLNGLPLCPWGIVSNFLTIRLYHRDKTPLAYQEFSLQGMRNPSVFREFYCLFHRRGLLEPTLGQQPIAHRLLEDTDNRQRTVGNKLYEEYRENRLSLIDHLNRREGHSLDTAIRIAQKLLDRIIFIAFCEDRQLLNANVIKSAFEDVPPFARVTNPKWRNFLNLFAAVDKGHKTVGIESGYNGGLFRHDPEVDELELDDTWTGFFRNVGQYDFRDEVNVDVLGQLFEKSITELEKLRVGGLFANGDLSEPVKNAMKKSAERKRFGVFYTPPDFTKFIVEATVRELIEQRFGALAVRRNVDPQSDHRAQDDERMLAYWRSCLEILRDIKVCDPACGSGAFLIAAYDELEEQYLQIADHIELHGDRKEADRLREDFPDTILGQNLYGVDLSHEAIEITQLALWIRSARRGKTLSDLSQHIVCGNSLVADRSVHDRAMDWQTTFPHVFDAEKSGFDCVIGNPPWERVKLQEREFFSFSAPKIAGAVSAATRRKLIEELKSDNADLFQRYAEAKDLAEKMLTYARKSGSYPLSGQGDINYYVLFAEAARSLVAPDGFVGLLTPSGIASDKTTRDFFNTLVEEKTLTQLYDFENRKKIFVDVDGRFKFTTLVFGGGEQMTEQADFVFFAHAMSDVRDSKRHITLTAEDMALLNPNTKTCPIFRSKRDAELTKDIYRRIPILIDRNRRSGGNPWGIKYLRMFDQTNDAEKFLSPDELKKKRFRLEGNHWIKGKSTYLPLYGAKMVQMYDHRAAGVVIEKEKWFRQGQTARTSLVSHQNPEFAVQPRWWASEENIQQAYQPALPSAHLAFKNVTSPTNLRTMIASFIPPVGVINSAPLIRTPESISERLRCCLLANLNAYILDYVARQKIGNVNLNFFIVEQLATLPPDAYAQRCRWNTRQTLEKWISDRVLKLSCTANDMLPLAEAAGFAKGVHKWKAPERMELMAELDAAYFLLYGIARPDAEYILSTFTGTQRRDESESGTFRTADLILSKYDEYAARS